MSAAWRSLAWLGLAWRSKTKQNDKTRKSTKTTKAYGQQNHKNFDY